VALTCTLPYYADFFRIRQELRDIIARTLAFYHDHLACYILIEVRGSEQ
jgi:hypothetical protein